MFLLPVFIHDKLYIPFNKDTSPYIDMIKPLFIYKNPDYYKKKRMGFWVDESTKNIHNYEFETYKDMNCIAIPRGGLEKIRNKFKKEVSIQCIDERLSLPGIEMHNSVTLRPDQERLVKVIMEKENCVIRSPQSSGKTEIGLYITELILRKSGNVVIVVWQRELVEEWTNRASERFGIPKNEIGLIQGSKKKIKPITIAMQQTLKNCIDKYKYSFGGVICDELQRFAANTYKYTINNLPARYRVGLSADETRKDKKEMFVYDLFGEVADEIKRSKLINNGAIHEVIIRVVPTDYNYYINDIPYLEVQDPRDKDFVGMITNMCQDEDRNNLIWEFMEPVFKSKSPSVIMSHRVNHVLYFDKFINSNRYKCGKVLGDKYKEEAEQTIRLAKEGKIQITIGTIPIKLGQGVNVPKWKRGFLLTPINNNRQQLEQTVERLSRTSKGKDDAVMYIFWDKNIYPYYLRNIKKSYRHVYLFDYETNKFEET